MTSQDHSSFESLAIFKIKMAVFGDGERFPYLIDCESGLPIFNSTLFVISQYRNASLAANTLEQVLRGVMLVHLAERGLGISLSRRFRSRTVLTQIEVDYLVQLASLSLRQLDQVSITMNGGNKKSSRGAASRGLVRRLPAPNQTAHVSANTRAIRLHYAAAYLKWLSDRELARIEAAAAAEQFYSRTGDMLRALKVRTPPVRSRGREAIDPAEREHLVRIVGKDSPENPWNHPFVRLRNRLIIMWGLSCGLRRGELLAMTVKQIELQFKRATILRNPDNQQDPRPYPPSVKTRERHVPLGAELMALTLEYIRERARTPIARKHGFLLVSKEGQPMSLSSLTKVFTTLRNRTPGISSTLTMHVLRHAWNEEFSDLVDAQLIPQEEELRIRNEAMGWSDRSRTGEKYQLRRTRAKAAEFSLDIQSKFMQSTAKK